MVSVMPTMTTNRATLTRLRVDEGLSQSALARLSGVDRTLIVKIEAGTRQGSLETLSNLADALGCEMSELVTIEAAS